MTDQSSQPEPMPGQPQDQQAATPQPPYTPAPQYGAFAPQENMPDGSGQQQSSEDQQGQQQPGQEPAKSKPGIKRIAIAAIAFVAALCVGVASGYYLRQPEVDNLAQKLKDTEKTLSATSDELTEKSNELQQSQEEKAQIQQDSNNGGSDTLGSGSGSNGSSDTQSRATGMETTTINGGLAITLHSIEEPASVPQEWNGPQTPLTPQANAKFFAAHVTVKNDTTGPIDITCSYPLEIRAVNSKGQTYTPIDDLFKIPGNPMCNDQLQPGMTSEVDYVFEMPNDTKVVGIVWRDVTDLSANNEYSAFKF